MLQSCESSGPWGYNCDKSCWFCETVFLRQWSRCSTVCRAVALTCVLDYPRVMITFPAWHHEILTYVKSSVLNHTQNSLYIATDSSFLNQDDNFCDQQHWEMKCSGTVLRTCVSQVAEGFVFPCSPALHWGLLDGYSWMQLDTAVMVALCGIFSILPQRRYTVSGVANEQAKAPFGHPSPPAQQTQGRF